MTRLLHTFSACGLYGKALAHLIPTKFNIGSCWLLAKRVGRQAARDRVMMTPDGDTELSCIMVLIEHFFPRCSSFFFSKKNRKNRKHFQSLKLTEGKVFGTLRIPIFGKKKGKYGNTKKCAKKNLGI